MKRFIGRAGLIAGIAGAMLVGTGAARHSSFRPRPKLLIFSKTNGFRHASIPAGIAAIRKLGAENGFEVDATEDSLAFTKANLSRYAALVFLNCSGNVFAIPQENALVDYMKRGGGFVGVHGATDCEYNWPWYGELIGAYFKSHPPPQMAKYGVVFNAHPSTASLPKVWQHFDEIYNYRFVNNNLHVLIRVDETSFEGGENGSFHPVAWYHDFGGGRSFYTGLGHTDECYADTLFLRHLLGGIKYAMKK